MENLGGWVTQTWSQKYSKPNAFLTLLKQQKVVIFLVWQKGVTMQPELIIKKRFGFCEFHIFNIKYPKRPKYMWKCWSLVRFISKHWGRIFLFIPNLLSLPGIWNEWLCWVLVLERSYNTEILKRISLQSNPLNDLLQRAPLPHSVPTTTTSSPRKTCKWFCW